jgi:hypothetical protein
MLAVRPAVPPQPEAYEGDSRRRGYGQKNEGEISRSSLVNASRRHGFAGILNHAGVSPLANFR